MSTDDEGRSFPKSMRQKRVLDAAAENPDASVDELASMVPSATTDLVERVFEEHGDPAAEDGTPEGSQPTAASTAQGETSTGADGSGDGEPGAPDAPEDATADDGSGDDAGSTGDGNASDGAAADDAGSAGDDDADPGAEPTDYPSPEDLSPKQREVLSVVAAEPEATQAEIGERLGVTQTTVNSRVNSIDGFDWSERESFVDGVFDGDPAPAGGDDGGPADATPADGEAGGEPSGGSGSESDGTSAGSSADADPGIERLRDRVAALEAADDRRGEDGSPFDDPELVHKVVHACMSSERITEAEELRILEAVLGR